MAVSSRARGAVVWEPIRVSTPTRVKTRVTPRSEDGDEITRGRATYQNARVHGEHRARVFGDLGNDVFLHGSREPPRDRPRASDASWK